MTVQTHVNSSLDQQVTIAVSGQQAIVFTGYGENHLIGQATITTEPGGGDDDTTVTVAYYENDAWQPAIVMWTWAVVGNDTQVVVESKNSSDDGWGASNTVFTFSGYGDDRDAPRSDPA